MSRQNIARASIDQQSALHGRMIVKIGKPRQQRHLHSGNFNRTGTHMYVQD